MLGNLEPIPLHLTTRVVLLTACGCRRIIKYWYEDCRDTILMQIFPAQICRPFHTGNIKPESHSCSYRRFSFVGHYDEETSLPLFEESL